mmetsp:Transcript_81905/g.244212  ORF Transcript_81905/g.244212 Transcript_81905/m.244212 type:complete len:237 (+) Transcript_81905:672-1382(+)
MDLGALNTASQLLELHTPSRVVHPQDGALARGGRQQSTRAVHRHGCDGGLVSGNDVRPFPGNRNIHVAQEARIEDDQGTPLLHARADEHDLLALCRETAQALGVVCRLNRVKQAQASEAIDVNLVVQHGDNQVPAKPDRLHRTSKSQFPDDADLPVVPENDLVWWKPRALAAAGKREDVCPKQHCNDTQTTAILKVTAMGEAKGVRAVHPEAILSATHKAGEVLVEADVQDLIDRV